MSGRFALINRLALQQIIGGFHLPEGRVGLEELADRIAIIREGRIVALGSPSELKHSMLGDAIMELRMACRVDGVADYLPADVRLVEVGEDWLRYRAADPERHNPLVLQQLMSAGFPIVTLTEVGRDLEAVYLRVVGEEIQAQEGEDG